MKVDTEIGALLAALALSCLVGTASAQDVPQQPDPGKGAPMPLLRTPDPVSPWQAFQHLRAGNAQVIAAHPGKKVAPRKRPYGPGRRIAAVAVPAGLRRSAAEIFAVNHADLLVLSSPGPLLRATEIAALQHGVTHDQISLLVILVDPQAALFARGEEARGPRSRSLARQVAAAREMAAAREVARRDRLGVATAYGILQRECVWQGSQLLEKKRMQGRFEVAVGLIDDRIGAIHWVTKWHQRWHLISSANAGELLRAMRAERDRAAKARRQEPQPDAAQPDATQPDATQPHESRGHEPAEKTHGKPGRHLP